MASRRPARPSPQLLGDAVVQRGELPPPIDATLLLDVLIGSVQHYLCFMRVPLADVQLEAIVDLVLAGARNGGATKKPSSRTRKRTT